MQSWSRDERALERKKTFSKELCSNVDRTKASDDALTLRSESRFNFLAMKRFDTSESLDDNEDDDYSQTDTAIPCAIMEIYSTDFNVVLKGIHYIHRQIRSKHFDRCDAIHSIVNAGAIPPLINHLSSENAFVQTIALTTLTTISSGNTEDIQKLVDEGVISSCVPLLNDQSSPVQSNACLLLGNISSESNTLRDEVIQHGGLIALLKLMSSFCSQNSPSATFPLSNSSSSIIQPSSQNPFLSSQSNSAITTAFEPLHPLQSQQIVPPSLSSPLGQHIIFFISQLSSSSFITSTHLTILLPFIKSSLLSVKNPCQPELFLPLADLFCTLSRFAARKIFSSFLIQCGFPSIIQPFITHKVSYISQIVLTTFYHLIANSSIESVKTFVTPSMFRQFSMILGEGDAISSADDAFSSPMHIKEEVCRILAIITAGAQDQIAMVVESGVLPSLIRILKGDGSGSKWKTDEANGEMKCSEMMDEDSASNFKEVQGEINSDEDVSDRSMDVENSFTEQMSSLEQAIADAEDSDEAVSASICSRAERVHLLSQDTPLRRQALKVVVNISYGSIDNIKALLELDVINALCIVMSTTPVCEVKVLLSALEAVVNLLRVKKTKQISSWMAEDHLTKLQGVSNEISFFDSISINEIMRLGIVLQHLELSSDEELRKNAHGILSMIQIKNE
ncbi:uncharacterized protein MONOS_14553 [Monocercomonoides exilis]|uniref:uncharacterized protein n=1 Tax=Monocercomonoides exilis TaxID=2049356 RepID=UPI00355A5F01|nr:hypothetical protein MONOS_14553 [Monocercomonoides exilis]|eukprot:MONOS_14553.1-p1 / transcript=MONOS_14553.1 / gene=MONOS_14553 / organism=Monocercomonoides_exilis_PA203 / gene_product=unspecified product / transcript_product=unspecified product / location=Mono_scaffold01023:15838-18145(+) / protein_length=677 / sequence_SO=supercontig / SO=protein_coding / is_pseudo=false